MGIVKKFGLFASRFWPARLGPAPMVWPLKLGGVAKDKSLSESIYRVFAPCLHCFLLRTTARFLAPGTETCVFRISSQKVTALPGKARPVGFDARGLSISITAQSHRRFGVAPTQTRRPSGTKKVCRIYPKTANHRCMSQQLASGASPPASASASSTKRGHSPPKESFCRTRSSGKKRVLYSI